MTDMQLALANEEDHKRGNWASEKCDSVFKVIITTSDQKSKKQRHMGKADP